MQQLEVISLVNSQDLVDRVTEDLIKAATELLSTKSTVNIGLTGGRIGTEISKHLLNSALGTNSQVHFWWTDERFLPVGNAERNDSVIPAKLDTAKNLHRLPSSDHGYELADAADNAAADLAALNSDKLMDFTLLSVGPDGHVASLFPNHAALTSESLVVGISDSPKPPKDRLTWTLAALNKSDQVWLLANGSEKESAVTHLMAGDKTIPAANVHGKNRTVLYYAK